VPKNVSYEAAFGLDQLSFNEDSKLIEWYNNGGLNEFVEFPFVESNSRKRKGCPKNTFQWLDTTNETDGFQPIGVESSFRLLPVSQDGGTKLLSKFTANAQTIEEHWWIVMSSYIASFLRSSQVNVDLSGAIEPLLDYNPSEHKNESDLVNYRLIFGDAAVIPYTSYLGLEIQQSPLTHKKACH
jgi:hypothetical protein